MCLVFISVVSAVLYLIIVIIIVGYRSVVRGPELLRVTVSVALNSIHFPKKEESREMDLSDPTPPIFANPFYCCVFFRPY